MRPRSRTRSPSADGIRASSAAGTDARTRAGRRASSRADDGADAVGDEPLLLARAGIPVAVGRDRVAAARALLAAHPGCDVIVADDGLQHYRLARDVEIVVVDAARGLGNGWLLPAGPLREPPARLDEVDAVVALVTAGGAGALDRARRAGG